MLTARVVNRVDEGIRSASRDALVAGITPANIRGAAFGPRQSPHIVGAFVGPLLALGLMLLRANDFRAVFWIAVIPSLLATAHAGVRRAGTGTAHRREAHESDSLGQPQAA